MNRLAKESSPYLKQHATNPVNWYPWCNEAFEEAQKRDIPVFLSIGYSTCHWCHVMAHESFEDTEVAQFLNENFIAVKVDREERPDIDQAYMHLCYAMTSQGGWPLTFILFPDKRPFFAGTYLTKYSKYGRLGLMELLRNVVAVWRNQRSALEAEANEVLGEIRGKNFEVAGKIDISHTTNAVNSFKKKFDEKHGGFGSKTKFPALHNLIFLTHYAHFFNDAHALKIVEKTIYEIIAGGIYDQIGFGIHRYSTDARWHLPHFEKMLYDQAMLILCLSELFQKTQNPLYKKIILRTIEFTQSTFKSPTGGYYTALDADSEHEEGKYYIFTYHELREILEAEEMDFLIKHLSIRERGNFYDEATGEETNANIFHWVEKPTGEISINWDALCDFEKFEPIRKKILAARNLRVKPHLDDKILTDTNGLYLAALSKAGQVLEDAKILNDAKDLAEFLISRASEGKLWHVENSREQIPGFLEDYAFCVWGLLEYYSVSQETKILLVAADITGFALQNFSGDDGGFFITAHNKKDELVIRTRDFFDGALPTGNAVMLKNLLRFFQITSDSKYGDAFDKLLLLFAGFTAEIPTSCAYALSVYLLSQNTAELVIAKPPKEFFKILSKRYLPNLAVTTLDTKLQERFLYLKNYDNTKEAYWLCRNFTCSAPFASLSQLEKNLD
ncbi:MAG: hypothetical protein LDLANPLL_02317 [Turneriella sp.]|nr:hypothetical protein [Turneriella sp.]